MSKYYHRFSFHLPNTTLSTCAQASCQEWKWQEVQARQCLVSLLGPLLIWPLEHCTSKRGCSWGSNGSSTGRCLPQFSSQSSVFIVNVVTDTCSKTFRFCFKPTVISLKGQQAWQVFNRFLVASYSDFLKYRMVFKSRSYRYKSN